jgi:uncharacterized protein (TIGR02646 family)
MRAIRKGQEPRELLQYRSQPGAVYDGPLFTPVKDKIRDQLLEEQGYLCAYCMRRIRKQDETDRGNMKIDHWRCQDHYPQEQLDYRNMLGACDGNEGQAPQQQTCDTRKGNSDLQYNPAVEADQIERRIRYLANGKIETDEPRPRCLPDGKIESIERPFYEELKRVLNLNHPRLIENRMAVMKAVLTRLGSLPGLRSVSEVRDLRDDWAALDKNGKLREYCGVAVYFLNKRLSRALRGNR